MENLFKGIQHIHGLGMIHRDIKPSNIVLAKKDDLTSVKIVDFGLVIDQYEDIEESKNTCGTLIY